MNRMPPSSKAFWRATRLFVIGVRDQFSKSFTVLNPTFARVAKSCCDQLSQLLAARHCSGDMNLFSQRKLLMSRSNFLVDLIHISLSSPFKSAKAAPSFMIAAWLASASTGSN